MSQPKKKKRICCAVQRLCCTQAVGHIIDTSIAPALSALHCTRLYAIRQTSLTRCDSLVSRRPSQKARGGHPATRVRHKEHSPHGSCCLCVCLSVCHRFTINSCVVWCASIIRLERAGNITGRQLKRDIKKQHKNARNIVELRFSPLPPHLFEGS